VADLRERGRRLVEDVFRKDGLEDLVCAVGARFGVSTASHGRCDWLGTDQR